VGQQGGDAVRDQVGRVLVAGAQEQEGQRDQLVPGQPTAFVACRHERREQVVAAHPPDQRREVPDERARRARIAPAQQCTEPPAQVDTLLLRYPQQVAQHGRGQRHRVGPDEVRGPVRLDAVEEPVRHPLYRRPQGGRPPRGERLADQAAQPGVVGRIHVQQVGVQRRRQRQAPPFLGIPLVQREPGIGEPGPHVRVAADQPGCGTVRQRHLSNRRLGHRKTLPAVLDAGGTR
jgi:hypothetical protein